MKNQNAFIPSTEDRWVFCLNAINKENCIKKFLELLSHPDTSVVNKNWKDSEKKDHIFPLDVKTWDVPLENVTLIFSVHDDLVRCKATIYNNNSEKWSDDKYLLSIEFIMPFEILDSIKEKINEGLYYKINAAYRDHLENIALKWMNEKENEILKEAK